MREDHHSSTVDAAAYYERQRGADAYIDDTPTRAELAADEDTRHLRSVPPRTLLQDVEAALLWTPSRLLDPTPDRHVRITARGVARFELHDGDDVEGLIAHFAAHERLDALHVSRDGHRFLYVRRLA